MSNEVVKTNRKSRFSEEITLWKKSLGRYWQLYLLLIPIILNFVIFHYIPMTGIQIAFKEFTLRDGIWGSEWVGFRHFTRFFNVHNFWTILYNTLILSAQSLFFSFPLSIGLALTLNEIRKKRLNGALQTIFFAPYFISTVVVVGMLVAFTSPSSGIINVLLMKLGVINEGIYFTRLEEWFRPMYIITSLWSNTGWGAIIYIAALSAIDSDVYEAASIDGASRFQQLFRITLPLLIPTIVIQLILRLGRVMNMGHEKALLMQNPGNIGSSQIISTFVFERGISNQQYDYATAIGLFNSVINLIILLIVNRMARKYSNVSLW
ncbi:MAG: ABC transporter permease subunit [Lachnospiraceae bacterium]|nr:ABC transporter permease subunit [Lachnospiraceae bacterium]